MATPSAPSPTGRPGAPAGSCDASGRSSTSTWLAPDARSPEPRSRCDGGCHPGVGRARAGSAAASGRADAGSVAARGRGIQRDDVVALFGTPDQTAGSVNDPVQQVEHGFEFNEKWVYERPRREPTRPRARVIYWQRYD